MTVVVHTGVVIGVQGQLVQVESNLRPGIPYFDLVGLAGSAIKEARTRVEQAVRSSGLQWPRKRIVLNLAPAELRKEGSALDLALAVACLAEDQTMDAERLRDAVFLGELSLDGSLRAVRGVLPIIEAARARGLRFAVVPTGNAHEADLVPGMTVIPASDIKEAFNWLEAGIIPSMPPRPSIEGRRKQSPDWRELRGQPLAKRAATVALAGAHNLLLTGPPGTGKTLLARCLPGLLPELEGDELLEVLRVRSVLQGEFQLGAVERPFRSPHHSVSTAGLIGGGQPLGPGEITIAHGGILFLDELPEFPRRALESLRQPLEEGCLTITRAGCRITFPARVMVLAAANPCPCGFLDSETRGCVCSPSAVSRYQARLSGPMLDRIDLQVRMDRPAAGLVLETTDNGPSSSDMRGLISTARQRAIKRQGCPNAQLGSDLLRHVKAEPAALRLLQLSSDSLGLSPRVTTRLLKVARSIADLEASQILNKEHLAEAFSLRLNAGQENSCAA